MIKEKAQDRKRWRHMVVRNLCWGEGADNRGACGCPEIETPKASRGKGRLLCL